MQVTLLVACHNVWDRMTIDGKNVAPVAMRGKFPLTGISSRLHRVKPHQAGATSSCRIFMHATKSRKLQRAILILLPMQCLHHHQLFNIRHSCNQVAVKKW